MRTRILLALAVLALCSADASAGPIRDRLRARFGRPAGPACSSCQPAPAVATPVVVQASYAAPVVRPAYLPAYVPAQSCPNGKCPLK